MLILAGIAYLLMALCATLFVQGTKRMEEDE
jgi:hypothetical protein